MPAPLKLEIKGVKWELLILTWGFRLFTDAMQEISEWLYRDDNRDEFLIILLDDQLNLANWVTGIPLYVLRMNRVSRAYFQSCEGS